MPEENEIRGLPLVGVREPTDEDRQGRKLLLITARLMGCVVIVGLHPDNYVVKTPGGTSVISVGRFYPHTHSYSQLKDWINWRTQTNMVQKSGRFIYHDPG